ncbi:MAG TPA: hypothetical protein PKD68_01855 [Candidatus Saccharibacteria bacterium]|nr:hypothetical protein [Candidatus Saccharibacteria bacterium]
MSVETFNPTTSARGAETARGQEVTSKTGNLVDRAAYRLLELANKLDRTKASALDTKDAALDQLAVGRAYAEDMGKKAVAGLVAGGELAVGLAVIGGEAIGRSAKQAGEWLEEKNDALTSTIDRGVDRAVSWTTSQVDSAKEAGRNVANTAGNAIGDIVLGVGDVAQTVARRAEQGLYNLDTKITATGERISNGIESGVESVKNFFREKADAAKLRREARRERWAARIARGKEFATTTATKGREVVDSTVEKGTAFAQSARKRGNAALKAAKAAQLVYTANVRS